MHFNYGFLLGYPMQEWLMRSAGVRKWRYVLPVAMIVAFSAIYEMAEALMAVILTPDRGEEFVGMQGDMWDSQEDMAMASSGLAAVITMTTPITQHRTCRNPFSRKGIGPAVDEVVNARSHHDLGQRSKWLLVLVR